MADILLLETDRQLAGNTAGYFRKAGHQLSYFSDPQSAVKSADGRRPDVIIMDIFLAARSGVEFLYELRSYPEWQDIPVIIIGRLSADELDGLDASFSQLNVTAYISKREASLKSLLSAVENILQPA